MKNMRKKFKVFWEKLGDLQWQLTISYALVTIIAVLAVETLLLLVVAIFSFPSQNERMAVYWAEQALEERIEALIDQPEPDWVELNLLLKYFQEAGFSETDFGLDDNPELLSEVMDLTQIDTRLPIFVLGSDSVVLASSLEHSFLQVGQRVGIEITQAFPTLENALESNQNIEALFVLDDYYAELYSISTPKILNATIPIISEANDRLLGVVCFSLAKPPWAVPSDFYNLSNFIGLTVIALIIGVTPIGILFGFITSRRFTKPIKALSKASEAWSTGDFNVIPEVKTKGELGRLSKQLARMAVQLQNFVQTKQQLAAIEERNRLARDLHDTVKQQTYATAMQLQAAQNMIDTNPEQAKVFLNSAMQLTRETQLELKTLIDELRPASLQDKGLVKAVKDYCELWTDQTSIKTDVKIIGGRSLSLSLEQALYRVVQETLANVLKHSNATCVHIQLEWLGDAVQLRIFDNGIGFREDSIDHSGMGLNNMHQRILDLGGAFSIKSTLGEGTEITAKLDLKEDGKDA
jgi:signal transduction histidine kinase